MSVSHTTDMMMFQAVENIMYPPRARHMTQTPFSWPTTRLLQFQSLAYQAVDYEQDPSAMSPGPLISKSYLMVSPVFRQMID